MNAKFRMPKLWGERKYTGTLKELVLTIIATTISIILTFGTSAWLSEREAEKARRLLAMTIIHDIDESLQVVRNRKEAEEKGHGISCYVIENKDRLESISLDTLYAFVAYVTSISFNSDREFKMTNENILSSSHETWRTLNDRKFLSNVQQFYNDRAVFEKVCQDWVYFKKPFTREEEYDLIMGGRFEGLVDMCRWMVESKRLKPYMDDVSMRMRVYLGFMEYVNLNEENKFLMGITEEDMEEFVNHTYMKETRAKERELTGTWNAVLADSQNEFSYELRKDHSFTMFQSTRMGTAFFRGKMLLQLTLSGTWAVEGDSLVLHYDMKSYKQEVDEKAISYPPRLEEEVRRFADYLANEKPGLVRRLEQDNRQAMGTNIDKTRTRLELTENSGFTRHFQKKITPKE